MAKSAAQKAFERNQRRQNRRHTVESVKAGMVPPADFTVPYGTYDPILDQQKRSADRGLGYLTQDTGKQLERGLVDYGIGKDQIETTSGRSLADLLTARQRGTEDYGRQTAQIGQNYQRLGNTQRQQQAASGAIGGVQAQAAAKRQANQAQDQSGVDLNYNRFLSDSTQTEGRLGEDKASALGQLLTGLSRNTTDLNEGLVRAQAENVFYGQDINELKVDQAKQAGLLPTQRGGTQHPQVKPPKNRKKPNVGRTLPGLKYGKPRY